MEKLNPILFYKKSLKSTSYHADEVINIYLLRPIASIIVWLLYSTSVTPNQVTILAVIVGIASAIAYGSGSTGGIILGGILIMLKDILDDADGQLARAKEMFSRRGRFLDSIGDVVVNLFVFAAITYALYQHHTSILTILLGAASFIAITLRVSYHVFYQVSLLHHEERYTLNRVTEEITEEDRNGDPVAYRLQQIFTVIYGWQDRLMQKIDKWCLSETGNNVDMEKWYGDWIGLRLSGLLGFGTEYAFLALCSWMNSLYLYLYINVFIMTGILLISVFYRRLWLSKHVKCQLNIN
jgi:phosphatidylglycerophosphate synthase